MHRELTYEGETRHWDRIRLITATPSVWPKDRRWVLRFIAFWCFFSRFSLRFTQLCGCVYKQQIAANICTYISYVGQSFQSQIHMEAFVFIATFYFQCCDTKNRLQRFWAEFQINKNERILVQKVSFDWNHYVSSIWLFFVLRWNL